MATNAILERETGTVLGCPPVDSARLHQQLVDVFDDGLLNDCYQGMQSERLSDIAAALERLLYGLAARRETMSSTEWERFVKLCRLHPLHELLQHDPFTRSAFEKRRGYPGDACVLDYIYMAHQFAAGRRPLENDDDDVSQLGSRLLRCTIQQGTCRGVRHRMWRAGRLIDEVATARPQAAVLSVASGHLREAEFSKAILNQELGQCVAFDQDPDSLLEVHECYSHLGVEAVTGSVKKIIRGSMKLGEFDLIYSTGLFDYMRQSLAQRLVTQLFSMLRPGGRLMIANFKEGIVGRGYMECFMDWNLVYRHHSDMYELAQLIDPNAIQQISTSTSPNDVIIYLDIVRC